MAAKKKLVWHRNKLCASWTEDGKRRRISLGVTDVTEGHRLIKRMNNPPRNYRKGSFIYFARMEGPEPFIKIGYASNVGVRLSNIKVSTPYKVELLASIEGTPQDEAALHARFADHRFRGEWFKPHPEILDFIQYAQCSLPNERPSAPQQTASQ